MIDPWLLLGAFILLANTLAQTMFSGLSPLVIEDVVDEGERIVVRARISNPGGT